MPLSRLRWRIHYCLFAGACVFATVGCFAKTSSNPVSVAGDSPWVKPPQEQPADSIFNRPMQRFTVEFTVHRITAPKGEFTRDGGVWKLVTGPLQSAKETLRLTANGVRAVIGRESDRPALLTELNKLADLKIAQDHVSPDVNRMLDLELGPCAPRLSIFHYDDLGEIHGRDFANAVARIKIAYEMRFTNLQEVLLEVAPELEEPPGPRKWVLSPEGFPQEAEEERKTTFSDLVFQARIPRGGFLLIGPTPAVYDQPLLARALFLQGNLADPSQVRESLYVISPIIRTYTQPSEVQAKAPS